ARATVPTRRSSDLRRRETAARRIGCARPTARELRTGQHRGAAATREVRAEIHRCAMAGAQPNTEAHRCATEARYAGSLTATLANSSRRSNGMHASMTARLLNGGCPFGSIGSSLLPHVRVLISMSVAGSER